MQSSPKCGVLPGRNLPASLILATGVIGRLSSQDLGPFGPKTS